MTQVFARDRKSKRSCDHPPQPGSSAEMAARARNAAAERNRGMLDLYDALIPWPAFCQAMRSHKWKR